MESFTQFQGHLAVTFSGCSKSGKTGSHTASVEVSSCVISDEAGEHRLSKNSRQRQNKINQQDPQISSLEAQNRKLSQLLEPKFLVETITQAVASSLNINGNNKPSNSSSGYTSKPFLGKPHPSQLAPGVDGSLDLALTCQYCKDTGHLKENCMKLTLRLALDKEEPGNTGARKAANNPADDNRPPKMEN